MVLVLVGAMVGEVVGGWLVRWLVDGVGVDGKRLMGRDGWKGWSWRHLVFQCSIRDRLAYRTVHQTGRAHPIAARPVEKEERTTHVAVGWLVTSIRRGT